MHLKIFRKEIKEIEGVLIYLDDLLIAAKTPEQHDEILTKVINRAKELNIKFNNSKIQLKVPEVKHLGFVFNSISMKPDPDYI